LLGGQVGGETRFHTWQHLSDCKRCPAVEPGGGKGSGGNRGNLDARRGCRDHGLQGKKEFCNSETDGLRERKRQGVLGNMTMKGSEKCITIVRAWETCCHITLSVKMEGVKLVSEPWSRGCRVVKKVHAGA